MNKASIIIKKIKSNPLTMIRLYLGICSRYMQYSVKMILARVYILFFGRHLLKRDIWLFEEKHTEARDNAFHLYSYVKKNHPEINSYYVIKKGSADEKKITNYKTTIHADTLKHYVYWIVSKYSINSQPHGAAPNLGEWLKQFKKICRNDQKVIFLQHGIIKDVLPGLDYSLTKFDLFTCSAVPELSYVREGLHYPENNAKLLGLCRFDRLSLGETKKNILVMPTFRKWLVSANPESEASVDEVESFKKSEFYNRYYELLTDKLFIENVKKNGYKIVFYMHYALQSYTGAFSSCANDTVIIADRNHYDVQQLLMNSAVLITDFSSVFFDFAYMGKPEVFYQFDEEKYRGNHYQQGYFNYHKDGFGPVFSKMRDIAEYIDKLFCMECKMEKQYIDRVDSFFAFRDDRNCERNYTAIKELG